MAKWNWLKGLRCVAGVGATLMASSMVMAEDASTIANVANPDHVFTQTSYSLADEVGGSCGTAGCQSDGCSGGDGGCDMFGLRCDQEEFNPFDGVDIGGWTQFGYSSQKTLFDNTNRQANRFNLNQGWIYIDKAAESECGEWAFGYHADFMYGTDGPNTQSFGNAGQNFDTDVGFTRGAGYGWAIPQLYVEATNGDTTVKAGHFYTLHGYEVVQATGNFFFTHAYSMNNSEPFTHTGVVVTQKVGDDTEVYAGWTAGWDTGFTQRNNSSSFMGGFSTAVTDDLTFTYITSMGNFGAIGDGYASSAVLDWQINDKLNYVLHNDLLRANAAHNDVVAINQYLLYQLSDCVGVGGRTQWWKNDGTSVYAITGGLNIKPHSQITLRPEVKYDWSPGGTVAAVDGVGGAKLAGGSNAATFAVDLIFTF
ncbi:MAG: porin [Rhodopirellula sp.]|nr:porin [Rhodopirellula sp.]